jgi:hypothetical protein
MRKSPWLLMIATSCVPLLAAPADDQAAVPPELVGKWVMRQGSGSAYRDRQTGQFSAPNTNTFAYGILADGRFEHAALLTSSLYQCTMQIFGYETGRVQISGDEITFVDQSATLTSTDSCRPQWNYEKPGKLGRMQYRWRLMRDQFGLALVLVRANGAEDVFYRQ